MSTETIEPETIEPGQRTVDLRVVINDRVVIANPQGWLYRGRRRARRTPRWLARLARIAFVSLLGTVVLGYGTVGFVMTVHPGR